MTTARAESQAAVRRSSPYRRIWWLLLAGVIVGGGVLLALNDVSSEVSSEDAVYAERILREANHGAIVRQGHPARFDEQIRTVLAVQDAVLSVAPGDEGIPFDQTRELSDLYRTRTGLCFDRSRAIEQILKHLGFEVRHAAVYSLKGTGSRLKALLTPGTPSHAVTEVKTARGWLLVDSNVRWIGLTPEGEPVDLSTLQQLDASDHVWHPRLESPMSSIFAAPFTYVLGLYSRHGRFYPPFMPIPDVDWSQLYFNFAGQP